MTPVYVTRCVGLTKCIGVHNSSALAYSNSRTRSVSQVTRVVLLWVNNHFSDFEGDPDMTNFLEEFQSNLEREVCK